MYCENHGSGDSSFSIVTGYGLEGRVSIPRRAPQPSVKWVPLALSPGPKRQGREADQSPPSGAEVKNGGAIPPLPPISSWANSPFYCVNHTKIYKCTMWVRSNTYLALRQVVHRVTAALYRLNECVRFRI
jgi:hypothetical protein